MRFSTFIALAALSPSLLLVSCKSSSSKKQKPMKMPNISVSSTAAPPKHSLSRGEYPFDARGNYVSSWAAEGEQRAGRSAVFGTDYSTWQSSHGSGRSSPPKKTTPASSSRPTSSPAKKTTSSTSSTAAKKPAPSKSSSGSLSHTVRSGDTLYGLALRYKSTVAKIKAANGLKSDIIRPGQNLRIPR